MKFENKKTEFKDEQGKDFLGYADLALTCLNSIDRNGCSPLEMAARIKVINPLQDLKIGGTHKLEEAHYETLKKCVNETKWTMIHKDIVAFTDYVNNMKK